MGIQTGLNETAHDEHPDTPMDVPPTVYAAWEQQHADAVRLRERQRQRARERAARAQILLERARRVLEQTARIEAAT